MGIEPTSEAWEASILPLYDARSFFQFLIIHNCALASTDRDGHFRISNWAPEVCPVIRMENRVGPPRDRPGVHPSRASATRAILPRFRVRALPAM
jgi:hypothetical protein